MKLRRILAAALVAGACGGVTRAQATDPLHLSLSCSQRSALTFRVTLENLSPLPTAVVIGTVLGNDKTYLLQTATLKVRRDGVPDQELQYVNPSIAGIAGRMDPWLVTLPPAASYSISVPARHFLALPDYVPEQFEIPSRVQVQLTTRDVGNPNLDMQGLRFIRVWVGKLTSRWIELPAACVARARAAAAAPAR